MGDISNPRLLYLKGLLFLLLGGLASALLLWDHPSFKAAAFLALAVWAFARAYYFAFHVIEHYIDGQFRYSGLSSLLGYLITQARGTPRGDAPRPE